MPDCTFAVYGGEGGKTGKPSDWWAKRCVPRNNHNGICNKKRNWMQTYMKTGQTGNNNETKHNDMTHVIMLY